MAKFQSLTLWAMRGYLERRDAPKPRYRKYLYAPEVRRQERTAKIWGGLLILACAVNAVMVTCACLVDAGLL